MSKRCVREAATREAAAPPPSRKQFGFFGEGSGLEKILSRSPDTVCQCIETRRAPCFQTSKFANSKKSVLLARDMPHSPTAATSHLQPGPFLPLGSPPLAVFASTAEVRRLLEQLRPHTERLIGLFKEWDDDDGSKITRKQFALTVQLLHQQVWLEAPGSRTTQAPPSRVLVGCFDLVDKAKVGTVELADLVTFLRAHNVMGDAGLLDATEAEPRGYPRPAARVASPARVRIDDNTRGSPGFARPRVVPSQQAVRGAGSPARGARRGSVQSDGNGSYGIMASYDDDDGVQLIETTASGPASPMASSMRSARPKRPKRPKSPNPNNNPNPNLNPKPSPKPKPKHKAYA